MLPDSMNVGIIAENIKKLEAMVQEAGAELPTPGEGDTGKIIKVGSSGYDLETDYATMDYTTTEHITGRKWIDGVSDVYTKVISGQFGEHDAIFTQIFEVINGITPISVYGFVRNAGETIFSDVEHFDVAYNKSYGNLYASGIPAAYSEGYFDIIVEYLKDPVPANETRKTTKKK